MDTLGREPRAAHAPSGRRPPNNLIIAVLALAGVTASFMQTIVIPIQGELPRLLGASREDAAWVITITLLVSAICTPISGKLGDMYGKRRVALTLLGLLSAGSVVAALAPSVVPLIIGRGLQGLGMGVIPLGISILRDTLPTERLGGATALVSATLGVGGALGLPLSAYVSEHYDWHMLFWVAAAMSLTVLVLVATLVPESVVRTGGRIDVAGVIGLAIGLAALLIAISRGGEWGWTSPLTLGLVAAGVLVLLIWGRLELRTPDPLVDLRVSARGPVLMTNLASVAMGFALFSSSVAFPQLLELPRSAGGIGLPLVQAALMLMPAGLAMLVMSPVAGRLESGFGPKPLLIAGSSIIAAGYLIAVLLDLQAWHILVINLLIGVGIGLGYAAMPNLIMGAVPQSETGAANGLNTLMRALGTASASAVIAAVLTSSSVQAGGATVPSRAGFESAFVLGLIAAVVCTVIAVFIPAPRPGDEPASRVRGR